MITAVLALVAIAALLVAAIERRGGRGLEREFRGHLAGELAAQQLRTAQLELMLDSVRSNALEILTPTDRDNHLLVSAPSLRAPGRTPAAGQAATIALTIDKLPEPLKAQVRAIEGEDAQLEYLETITRELDAGADADELADRLFGA